MRYKCVIPMVVDYEAKEREKQQKEEENRLATKTEFVDKTEIDESKNRVLEHFKQVCQTVNNKVETPTKKKKKKKCKNVVLSQMHGRKRKRESNIKNESQEKSYDKNFFTSMSSLDTTIAHVSKQIKSNVEIIGEQNVQQSFAQNSDNSEVLKPMR